MKNTGDKIVSDKKLAIITARGGSKRIPGKNIKEFCGKPILFYPIEAALKSGIFDEVMVSTEDETIARLAKQAGAKVPFLRSLENADDFATTDQVIMEVLNEYKARGEYFESFCCIYPTAPFLTAERLREAMALLEKGDSVMPVAAFSYPPQRGIIINPLGYIERKYPEFINTRSQDLEKLYHDAGQFYACRTKAFMKEGTTDVEALVPLCLSEWEVQDIDTPEDWKMAELKYKYSNKYSKS